MGNGELISTSILQKAEELPAGCYIFRLKGEGYTGNDLPPGNNSYKYGTACIYKRSGTSIIVVLYGEAVNSPMAINSRLNDWTGWQTYVTNTDLGGAVFKTASGNLQYGMNGIYVGKFNNGPIEDDGAPFSSCIYLIGTGTNQTSIYAFAITQYFGGHLFFNRLNAANVMELEKWKKLIA